MCGLAGFFERTAGTSSEQFRSIAERMSAAIRHRGPDDDDVWYDAEAGIALGHRRLSIIDLSTHGRQPMTSESGRYVIAYNGEVYNFPSLRKELEPLGHTFRGHSDTEVILAAIEEWGLETALGRLVGMFAFALWDRTSRRLQLVRDRLGIKPLYYGWTGQTFLFASELRAIEQHPQFKGEVNREALSLYLRYSYVPAPWSMLTGIRKLMPGTILTTDGIVDGESTTAYWSLHDVAERGVRSPFTGDEAEATEHLDNLLREATRQRMIADVPIGVLLSGGVDSSTVAALMQSESVTPVKSFTIGFPDSGFDESKDARLVAAHLKTNHHELAVTAQDAIDIIPELPALTDEPFADSSQIPSLLISKLARQHVKVCLSGDGGDETFGGYNRYIWANGVFNRSRLAPLPIRIATGALLTAVSPISWDRAFRTVRALLPRNFQLHDAGDKIHKTGMVITSPDRATMYRRLVSLCQEPNEITVKSQEPTFALDRYNAWDGITDFTSQMMLYDTTNYLPDDILTKVDRASMAASLEIRVPLLDHRVVEFAWSLPLSLKIKDRVGKSVLRRVLDRHVPRDLIDRAKWGFSVPIHDWLRGPLRAWAENLLDENLLNSEEFFRPEPIMKMWEQHLSGSRNWHHQLWSVLVFQEWLRHRREGFRVSESAA